MASVNGRPRKISGALEAEGQVFHEKFDQLNNHQNITNLSGASLDLT